MMNNNKTMNNKTINKFDKINKVTDVWAVTGLIDAEGSFVVNILKDNTCTFGFQLTVSFELGMHVRDKNLLQTIRDAFSVGAVYFNKKDNTCKWKVSSLTKLNDTIIPFLKQYYLINTKRSNF